MKESIAIRFLFIITIVFSTLISFAQIPIDLRGKANKKITTSFKGEKLEPGAEIHLIEYGGDIDGTDRYYTVVVNDQKDRIKEKDIKNIDLEEQNTLSSLWSTILVTESDLYHNLIKEGMHYSIRNDADEESIYFIDKYNEYSLFFDDIYLEEYLQSLLPSIHPVTLTDNRPGNLSIKVMIDNNPNAFCLPNGTMMITTGMLSLIDSEAELVAILTHEVAHFVLDHYVDNIIQEEKRKKRAEFWAAFATAMAAAGDAYLATQDPDHTFGVITASTAVISYTLAQGINERLGLKYSREQEEEADKVAMKVLEHLSISPDALATVFDKLRNYAISIGNYAAFSSGGTHPSLTTRIIAAGRPRPNDFIEPSYYLKTSNANTSTAYLEFYNQHFNDADRIITRNITANIATEDDYILKARLLRNMFNDKANMESALNYLIKADELSVVPRYTTSKDRGLTLMRLDRFPAAQGAFKEYLSGIAKIENKSNWLQDEIEWTRKMIYKCEQINDPNNLLTIIED